MEQDRFEQLLAGCKTAVERFVYYKLPGRADAEDVLQEIYLTAFQKIDTLRAEEAFKAWLLRIAANKCGDFYRSRARQLEIPLDDLYVSVLAAGRMGVTEVSAVRETLSALAPREQQILYLYYLRNKPQAEIAALLGIPLGTVKSRLHAAKGKFRAQYPYPPRAAVPNPKGELKMKEFPDIMPAYKITASDEPPFPVKWEEMMGWFLIPKLGESVAWALYDQPAGTRTETTEMRVTGRASIHDVEGVEIETVQRNPVGWNDLEGRDTVERRFVAQLTDTHCRILAESHVQGGVRRLFTFLDGDDFLPNWGFGEDNCGKETNLAPRGVVTRRGGAVTCDKIPAALDIVGRYTVEIAGKSYDTVCVMDIEQYETGIATEQFLDRHGHTVLWRRYNRDDWAFRHYQKKWTEMLPDNERITVNGETYVHWYDCITDYIL